MWPNPSGAACSGVVSGERGGAGTGRSSHRPERGRAGRGGLVSSRRGQELEQQTQAEFGSRLGFDFSQVRVHTGATARVATQSVGAQAFTYGQHVVLGETADRHLIAHELAHVAQQPPTSGAPQRLSVPGGPEEQAADHAADAVSAGRTSVVARNAHTAATVMRQMDPRHARGFGGEQDMGFRGDPANGRAFVEGPSGSAGHNVTSRGFDGVAVRTRGPFEVHVLDNKSLARGGNVSSATALTRNLVQNLEDIIARVSGPNSNLPSGLQRQVLDALTAARDALRAGGSLPNNVKLVVTGAGGRSTGSPRTSRREVSSSATWTSRIRHRRPGVAVRPHRRVGELPGGPGNAGGSGTRGAAGTGPGAGTSTGADPVPGAGAQTGEGPTGGAAAGAGVEPAPGVGGAKPGAQGGGGKPGGGGKLGGALKTIGPAVAVALNNYLMAREDAKQVPGRVERALSDQKLQNQADDLVEHNRLDIARKQHKGWSVYLTVRGEVGLYQRHPGQPERA